MGTIAASLKYVFAAFGLLACALAAQSAWDEYAFLSRAAIVRGIVVPGPGSADVPAFRYEYPPGIVREGRAKGAYGAYRGYAPGDVVALYVDPARPARAELRRFPEQWMEPLLSGGFGLLSATLGIGLIACARRREKRIAYLLRHGIKIKAFITGIGIDGSIALGEASPVVVEASALVDGKLYRYRSEELWFDPGPYLDRDEVDVYYQAGNPARYHMDLSSLPKRGK